MNRSEARTTTVDGIRTRWHESGDGIPLILVHGIPTSPLLWRHVVPEVKGARVYCLEMIGYGDSIPEGVGEDISMSRQADHLLRWMDDQGIEQAVLGGHDLGGGVAQIAAVRQRARCAGLFLTNSIGYDSWPIPSVRFMESMHGVVEHLPDAAVEQVLRSFIHRGHDDAERADKAFEVHMAPYRRHGTASAFTHQIHHLHTQDTLAVQDDLARLAVPARIVWGAADQFQKVEYAERFAEDLDTTVERIEEGRHFTPEDHPHAVAGALNDLVREVRRTSASAVPHGRR